MSLGTLSGTMSVPLREAMAACPQSPTVQRQPGIVSRRNEAIDAIRAFAAAGIVFVHAAESPTFDKWGNLFRFGVPFFLFASFYYQSLSLRRNPGRTLVRVIGGRIKRLYVPFLVWSVIYLITRDIERVLLHHMALVEPRLSMLWTGTEYHLWFLPFLLAGSVVLTIVHKGILQRDGIWRWVAIATALGLGCLFASLRLPAMPSADQLLFDDPTYTYIQWWLAVPAACWGLAFAWFMTMGSDIYGVAAIVGWGGVALLTICSLRQAWHGIELAPRAFTGLGSMLASLMPWHTSAAAGLARIGRKGYGIYLCHVIPVEIIHSIVHQRHLNASAWLDVANFALSFVGSWMIVSLLGRSRRLAWLNG